jgi:heat shock protein HslJ
MKNICKNLFALRLSLESSMHKEGRMRTALILSLCLVAIENTFAWAGQTPALEGMQWKMVSYLDNKGQTVAALPKSEVTATFQGGTISGRDGCNQYGASYKTTGNALTIKLGMSTMMACEQKIMEQAQGFLSALGSSATFQISGNQLQILKSNGQVAVTFAVLEATPLAGVTWQGTGYNNGKGGVQSLAAGTMITAIFDGNGALSGSASCNQYSSRFEAVANTIKISDAIATTRMACLEPAMQQEAAYLAALAKASAYRIESNRLELRDASGALQASFVAR